MKPKNNNKSGQYPVFREAVKKVLSDAEEPLSWSEIREMAGLRWLRPSCFWVKRLEDEIGLIRRKKDGNNVWSLGAAPREAPNMGEKGRYGKSKRR